MIQPLDLAALIASRLCHDLVGPIGAISNGIEVLSDENDAEMRKSAVDLMAFSAGEATRRLKFYRLAYGVSGGEDVSLRLRDARAAACEMFGEGRVTLRWGDGEAPRGEPGKPAVRLLLNLLALAAETLPRGGTLNVSVTETLDSWRFEVLAEGMGARLTPEARNLLGPAPSLDRLSPRTLQPFLTARMASALEAAIDLDTSEENRIRLSATAPRR